MVHGLSIGLPHQPRPDAEGPVPEAGTLRVDEQLCRVRGSGGGHLPPTGRNGYGDVFLGGVRHNLYDMAGNTDY